MSRAMVTTLAALAFALVACGTPPGDPGTTTSTSTLTSTSTSEPAKRIKVPDVSGMNHQDAQDTMQRAGLYNLREVDGTGQGRMLVLDRNWVQTGQDPAAGTEVPADAVITLTAVKKTDR
ncbi:PASTA domain-containing protein [Amycolatopsis sp. NPDC051371]|uniref:PASTA domain-containing protein n=1 Tax=Amycolatopsis sp. NPDC051371 TaxID=3155800 RepID=UPI00341DCBBE